MTISVTSWTTTSAEHVRARDTHSEIERSSGSDDFAGILAGAVQSSAPKPEPRQAKEQEGTSELDKPEEQVEKGDDKKKVKRSRSRGVDAAATPSAATDTNEIVQATSALDPEMQAKLARVTERMRAETGHEVKVTETYRTQDRQDALFAQGRETDGPIVTWTRNSKHTQGRAVDVTLEGAGMDAYAILQRIAKEEGLRTLGARDPGHLELSSSGRLLNAAAMAANDSTPLVPAEPADATGRGQVSIARLAQVAHVAQVTVEKPAEVARVAAVARPEIPGVTSRTQPVPTVTSGESAQVMIDDARGARRSSADSGDSNSSSSNNSNNEQRGGYSALAAAVALRDASPSLAPTSIVGGSETILSGAERAAQIIAAYQDAPARPLSQITMSVDAGNGITDKVQVALRGSSLNAAIDTGDMRGAEAMRARADELVRALTREGIDVEALRVRAAAGAGAVHVPTSQQSSDAGQSKFERNQQWQQQHERQRSQDDGRRQQQRDQRGGRDQ